MEPWNTSTTPSKKKPPAAPPERTEGTRRKEARPPLQAATWRKMTRGPLTPTNRKHKPLKEHMSTSNDNTQPLTAETANAIVNALGALVFATVRQLPAEKQTAFASDLARLAQSQEQQGQTATETILLDMHRAAVAAAS